MALFDDSDITQRWKYEVKLLMITLPNNKMIEIPPMRVKKITKEENFEEMYFPLIKLTLILDAETYYEILKNKNDCCIQIRLDMFYFKNETEERSMSKIYLNTSFQLILDEDTDDMYNSLKEDENKSDYKKRIADISDKLDKVSNEVSFYIFRPTINTIKQNVNKLLQNCNVADSIVYLATVAKLNNVVMAQPDNIRVYNELLIPPLSILRSLEFIDLYYGIYKEGTMIYFGVTNTYIIPYNGKCVARTYNETKVTNIIIPKSTNVSHKNILGSIKKRGIDDKKYLLADYSSIDIQNQSISNGYINSNNIDAIDSYDGTKSNGKSKAIEKNKNFTKIVENKTMNTFFSSMYAAQSDGKSTVVSLRIQDFDLTAFTPNKEFNLLFEDMRYRKKYAGSYVLSGIKTEFSLESGYFGVSAVVVLRKI